MSNHLDTQHSVHIKLKKTILNLISQIVYSFMTENSYMESNIFNQLTTQVQVNNLIVFQSEKTSTCGDLYLVVLLCYVTFKVKT